MQSFKFKRVDPNDTDLMEQIYRLRFQVYGNERTFIPTDDYPDGMEYDEFDDHAVHIVAINRFGEVVGALRIITNRETTLPIERHASHVRLTPPEPDVLCFAEISRLVISKKMRQRSFGLLHQMGFSGRGAGGKKGTSQRGFLRYAKPLAFGLCKKAYEESVAEGVTHWLSLMEKGLHSLLKMYGFPFYCIGPEVDVMGMVNPYLAEVKDCAYSLEDYYGELQPATVSPTNFFPRPNNFVRLLAGSAS